MQIIAITTTITLHSKRATFVIRDGSSIDIDDATNITQENIILLIQITR